MKHIFAFIFTLCCVATMSAQGVVRTGLYAKDGVVLYSDPQSEVTVAVTVKSTLFTPGEFARYAQKMLGVRASLAVLSVLAARKASTPLPSSCAKTDIP